MWSSDDPSFTDWNAGTLQPRLVLYYYDGPAIFTAQVGLTELLLYKFDEGDSSDFFIAIPVANGVINALKNNTLSVRGALLGASNCWVLELGPGLTVEKYWQALPNQLPESALPQRGVSISPSVKPAADYLEQATSFFSVRFTGSDLSDSGIPFSAFKTLVDSAYESFRRIFPAPIVDQRSLGRSLDINLLQPRFSSLILAIDRPSIDPLHAKKMLKREIDPTLFEPKFEKNRRDFFDRMSELLIEAEKGRIKKSYAIEHFYTLAQVNSVVPTSGSFVDQVEFRSQLAELDSVIINDRLGDTFRDAYRIAELAPRVLSGVIVEVNAESGTLILRDNADRQTTCFFERDEFDGFDFSIGENIRVRGKHWTRKRRDGMKISSLLSRK